MVSSENIKERKIEIKFNLEKFTNIDKIILVPKIDTAARAGIDNKKEIFAESYLLKFKILAAVIVIPDLLTPGTKDII